MTKATGGAALMVAIALIDEMENVRAGYSKESIAELAESIVQQGVLNPLIVRRKGERFELIAGYRRIRASKQAGLREIPVTIKDVDDVGAAEIQLVENLQREDLTPLDEAAGFERLVVEMKRTPKDVAAEIGKDEAYVQRRRRLLKLPDVAKKALAAGKVSLAHAMTLLKIEDDALRAKAAETVIKGYRGEGGPLSLSQADDLVRREYLLKLTTVPFDVADAKLVPEAGACGPCPFRSGNVADLFGGKEGNLCTKPSCFNLKVERAFERSAEKLKKGGAEIVPLDQARKIFREYSDQPADAWVDSNARAWDVSETKTWKQILGKHAPQTFVACDRTGKARELYRKTDVAGAMKKAGVKRRFGSGSGSSDGYAQKARAAAKKAKAAARIDGAAIGAAIAKIESSKSGDFLFQNAILRMIAHAVVDFAWYDVTKRVVARRAPATDKKGGAFSSSVATAVHKLIESTSDKATLIGLLVEYSMTRASSQGGRGTGSLGLAAMLKLVGVDRAKVQRALEAEAKAKAAAKKTKAKKVKAAKPKKGARAAA